MITLENHATSAVGRPRPGIEVRIEGAQRANGAVRPGVVVDGSAVTTGWALRSQTLGGRETLTQS